MEPNGTRTSKREKPDRNNRQDLINMTVTRTEIYGNDNQKIQKNITTNAKHKHALSESADISLIILHFIKIPF